MDIVSTVISVIQGIVKYAPDVVKAFGIVRDFIKGLFGAGVISLDQQQKLLAMVESILAAHQSGPPPGWAVEPDPTEDSDDSGPVIDLGKIQPTTPPVAGPPDVEPNLVITKVYAPIGGRQDVCNAAGNCWRLLVADIVKTPASGGQYWQAGALRFFVTDAALAAIVPV